VVQFGKFLRWLFGINAILFGAICLRYLWVWDVAGGSLARLAGYAMLAGIYATAFLQLGKGGRKARYWALGASALNVPFYWIVQPAWLWTAAGILGLFLFRRQENVDRVAAKGVKPTRTRGDGTSTSMDVIANLALFAGFLLAGSYWASWAIHEKLPDDGSMLARLLLIEAAMLITTVAHESGHALAAILVKMKVRRFVVGPLEGSFRGGSWQLKFRPAGFLGTPGGVGVVPSTMTRLRTRHAIVAAAGPVASLIVGLAAMSAALASKGHFWESCWMLAAYTSTFSLLAFAFNLIPMRPESAYSDGARIYQLLSGSPWADVHLALSMGSCTLASPMRPRDCDIEVLERAATFLSRGLEGLLLRVQAQAYFHDCGLIPKAIKALEGAEAVYDESVGDMRADLHKSFVFANAFLKRDAVRARQWWDRMEAKGSATEDAEYWFSRSALLLAEGSLNEAEAALNVSAEMMRELPRVGAYDYERDCVGQIRVAMEANITITATKAGNLTTKQSPESRASRTRLCLL
jgi:Zn-dependent protease